MQYLNTINILNITKELNYIVSRHNKTRDKLQCYWKESYYSIFCLMSAIVEVPSESWREFHTLAAKYEKELSCCFWIRKRQNVIHKIWQSVQVTGKFPFIQETHRQCGHLASVGLMQEGNMYKSV